MSDRERGTSTVLWFYWPSSSWWALFTFLASTGRCIKWTMGTSITTLIITSTTIITTTMEMNTRWCNWSIKWEIKSGIFQWDCKEWKGLSKKYPEIWTTKFMAWGNKLKSKQMSFCKESRKGWMRSKKVLAQFQITVAQTAIGERRPTGLTRNLNGPRGNLSKSIETTSKTTMTSDPIHYSKYLFLCIQHHSHLW